MEASKRVYNDRFLYADPLAKSSLSRSTLYRLSKKRKASEGDTHTSGDTCMSSTTGEVFQEHGDDRRDHVVLDPSKTPENLKQTLKVCTGKKLAS